MPDCRLEDSTMFCSSFFDFPFARIMLSFVVGSIETLAHRVSAQRVSINCFDGRHVCFDETR